MRKHKFKVWDKINKRWIEAFKIVLSIDGEVMAIEDLAGGTYGLHQAELVQFTGLKANGVELYEGDIVSCTARGETRQEVVEFGTVNGETYGYHFLYEFMDWFELNINLSKISIIGNIYENPELLEQL